MALDVSQNIIIPQDGRRDPFKANKGEKCKYLLPRVAKLQRSQKIETDERRWKSQEESSTQKIGRITE